MRSDLRSKAAHRRHASPVRDAIAFAAVLDTGLAADQLPDIATLRARFAPDPAALPDSTVQLTPLAAYEALLGVDPEELA